MTASFTITDKGFKEAIAKLNSLQQLRALRPSVKAATYYLKGQMMVYPPETDANKPGSYPKRWYQRGYGPKWALKGGGVHGRKTSQNLMQSWGIKMQHAGLTGVIGTNVKYARYVQDADKQASFHRANKWRTVQSVAAEFGPLALRYIAQAIERILAKKG